MGLSVDPSLKQPVKLIPPPLPSSLNQLLKYAFSFLPLLITSCFTKTYSTYRFLNLLSTHFVSYLFLIIFGIIYLSPF